MCVWKNLVELDSNYQTYNVLYNKMRLSIIVTIIYSLKSHETKVNQFKCMPCYDDLGFVADNEAR